MIYELSLVAKSEQSDEQIAALCQIVKDVVADFKGELFIEDDWGRMSFAQATSEGVPTGRFVYFLYKATAGANEEITRRFRINEGHLKNLVIKLGEESEQDAIIKAYKTPFSKKYNGSLLDSSENDEKASDVEKDRRKFSRRRTCWFTAKKIKADWKDPQTYNWLVNEFGKISPARISSVSRKHQRFANTAIKRARQLGVISHLSNAVASAQ